MNKLIDDADLFREAVRDAVPLKHAPRSTPAPKKPPPVPVQTILDEHQALDEALTRPIRADDALEIGDEPTFVRDGVSPTVLRKLRRGHWVVQGELDLHGATRDEAYEMVGAFLRRAVRRGARCVRVIHGKGLGSKNREPVLKQKVKLWLARREEVIAFCQAPGVQGGSGAVLVLLKAGTPG